MKMKLRLKVCVGLLLGLTATLTPAAETNKAAPPSLSAAHPAIRADWQKRLTLGPGDVLNFSLFDATDTSRENVAVGPDGRITYLHAQNIMATGMTIDELRAKMDEELAKYYRNPRTIITPAAIRSKRYYVLGAVTQKGVFVLDRPTSVIEAVAKAGGLETGIYDRSTVEQADLTHSFLVRKGEKLSVDFEKLFQEGDLTQNVALEPDDYLYFPSSSLNEIYVLGEVLAPGPLGYKANSSIIGAIAERGGFSPRAYQGRVLVVRGSLNKPETFVIDAKDMLKAKTLNFKLQPHDIVYVAARPWIKAEELLDSATQSFVQAAVVTWTGIHATPRP
jgi:protein involved in polysaccharide export with SLBB domain